MSKAQRKRNRKVRNTQMNWGRIDRERQEMNASIRRLERSRYLHTVSTNATAEFLELVNG
jgi:hypothetical protein